MKTKIAVLVTATVFICGFAAGQAEEQTKVLLPSGTTSAKIEAANKALALRWWREFWDERKLDAWPQYMAADFRNHHEGQPAKGAQALVDWLKATNMTPRPGAKPRAKNQPQLFAIAEGNLVFVAHVPRDYDPANPSAVDPEREIEGEVLRIENGKIAEQWYVGPTAP